MLHMSARTAALCLWWWAAIASSAMALDVPQWLEAAPRAAEDAAFTAGCYLPESIRDVQRYYGVTPLDRDELELKGFTRRAQRGGNLLLATVKPGDEPATITWRWRQKNARYSNRIFIGLADLASAARTGSERLAVYHNDVELGVIQLDQRRTLPYVYPYDWDAADKAGNLPMELSFEPAWQLFLLGFTLNERRMIVLGDTITLKAQTPGVYAVRDLMFVPRTDTVPTIAHEVRHAQAKLWRHGPRRGQLQFAWVTHLPSRCMLLWDVDRAKLEAGLGQVIEQDRYAENHQAFVGAALEPGQTVHYRVLAQSHDGRRVASPIYSQQMSSPAPQQQQGSLPLSFVDAPPLDRAAPAHAIVPFSAGQLLDLSCVRLVDAGNSQAVPVQVERQASYADDSVRWLGVHFQAQPGRSYALQWGPAVRAAAAAGLQMQEEERTLTVSDARLRVRFARDASAGLAEIEIDPGQPQALRWGRDDVQLWMTDGQGARYSAGPPSQWRIEQAGPLRTVVVTQGHFESDGKPLFEYIARWQVHAEHPGIDLELTVGNDAPDPAPIYSEQRTITPVGSMYLGLRVPDDSSAPVQLGADGSMHALPQGPVHLLQKDESSVWDRAQNDRVAALRRLDGRVIVQHPAAPLAVHVENFWQQYPKSIELADSQLRIGLMPAINGVDYPREPLQTYAKLYYAMPDGRYRIMAGTQKTHRLRLAFGPQAASIAQQDRMLGTPLLLSPEPKAMCATGAFGPLLPLTDAYADIDRWIDKHLDVFLANRETNREYGLLNFGDWFGERGVNWGNLEYDLTQAASQEFLRRAQRRWFEVGYQTATHRSDVDTIHYGRNAGLQVTHAGCHTGREYLAEQGYTVAQLRGQFPRLPYPQTFHAGHMWIWGQVNYAAMTGSGRLRQVIEQFGQTRSASACYRLSPLHHRGWSLTAFSALYTLDADPFYLNAARLTADRYEHVVDEVTGVVWPELYDHNTIGAVNRLALWVYAELTGDDRGRALLMRSAKTIRQTLWDDAVQGIVVPHHGWWAVRHDKPDWTPIFAEVARQSDDPQWRQMLRTHIQDGMFDQDNRSKDVSSIIQFASFYPALLQRAGIDSVHAGQPSDDVMATRRAAGRRGIQPPGESPRQTQELPEEPAAPAPASPDEGKPLP